MGLNSEIFLFLTQEDQYDHNISQFQTKSGESFYFREGYDVAVYEAHKQYNLRSRTIDVPEPIKPKDSKQLKKTKDKAALTDSSDKTKSNLKEVTVEDVSDVQPSKNHLSIFPPRKGNSCGTPENNFKTEVPQNNALDQ